MLAGFGGSYGDAYFRRSDKLLVGGQVLRHGKQQFAVPLAHLGQRIGEEPQLAPVLLVRRSGAVVLGSGKHRLLSGSHALVEQAVKRNPQRPGVFLQGLHGGHGVPILDTRGVTTQQPGALLNIALAQLSGFPDFL